MEIITANSLGDGVSCSRPAAGVCTTSRQSSCLRVEGIGRGGTLAAPKHDETRPLVRALPH